MDAPCFLYTDDIVYGKYFDAPIGILLFSVVELLCCRAADRELLAFCTRCYACKKPIFC
jgi:hypothetical protein